MTLHLQNTFKNDIQVNIIIVNNATSHSSLFQLTFLGTDQRQCWHQSLVFLTYLKALHHHPVVVHIYWSKVIFSKRNKILGFSYIKRFCFLEGYTFVSDFSYCYTVRITLLVKPYLSLSYSQLSYIR